MKYHIGISKYLFKSYFVRSRFFVHFSQATTVTGSKFQLNIWSSRYFFKALPLKSCYFGLPVFFLAVNFKSHLAYGLGQTIEQ